MFTFDDDDNDQNLNLANSEDDTTPKSPFSRPSRPNQPPVDNSTEKPTLPKKFPPKTSTESSGSGFPKKPVKPSGEPSTPLPARPVPTFNAPSRQPSTPIEEPVEEPLQPSSEEEAYLQRLMNTNVQAQPAPVPVEPLKRVQPEPGYLAPTPQPVPTPVSEDVEEPEPTKKKGFFSPKPKPAKKVKGEKKSKPAKENQYAGGRRQILIIRIIAGTVAAVIGLVGLKAIFLPDTGLSENQVKATAQQAVNFTGFPTLSGQQFAMDFGRAYFTFSNDDQTRATTLAAFGSDDLIKKIDIQLMSVDEYNKQKKPEDPSYNQYLIQQSIKYGPYVVASNNLTATDAVFTIKVGLNDGAVVYMDVPVKYDADNFSLTLAGPPSFTKPIQNVGKTDSSEYTANFGTSDEKIQKDFTPDLEAYLAAWAQSDSTIINRYLLDGATANAKRGLQGSVQFYSLDSFNVEPYDDTRPQTANARRAEITVTWQDPKTGLRYPQQYRLLLGLNKDKSWSIYDIENFAVLN